MGNILECSKIMNHQRNLVSENIPEFRSTAFPAVKDRPLSSLILLYLFIFTSQISSTKSSDTKEWAFPGNRNHVLTAEASVFILNISCLLAHYMLHHDTIVLDTPSLRKLKVLLPESRLTCKAVESLACTFLACTVPPPTTDTRLTQAMHFANFRTQTLMPQYHLRACFSMDGYPGLVTSL